MDEEYCLFCYEEPDKCFCKHEDLGAKKYFLKFFVDSMKEFCPRKANKIQLHDAVDFLNDWYDHHFSG